MSDDDTTPADTTPESDAAGAAPAAGGVWAGGEDHAEQSRPAAARLDVEQARTGLTAWARAHRPGAEVTDVHLAEGNGMSSETLLFDVQPADGPAEHLVARVAPRTESMPVFPHYDMALQAAVMSLVGATTTLPVPEIVDVHTEPDLLGMPFVVMRRLPGDALPDVPPYTFEGWLHEASEEQRAALRDRTVDVVAQVHAVPVDDEVARIFGESSPPSADEALDAMLRREREYYDWARQGAPRSPLIEAGLDWLEAHRPAESGAAVLAWGDSRPANLLWSGDCEVTAVLDWEMTALAPRGSDVGWMVFVHDFFQFIAEMFEMTGLPDLFRADDVLARYRERTGADVPNLEYYRVYGAVRHAIIMYRIALRSVFHGGAEMPENPDQLVLHAPLLARMIGRDA